MVAYPLYISLDTLHFLSVFFLMACLDSNMYNNNNNNNNNNKNNTNPNNSQSQPPPMSSPRISFSNDFVDSSFLHHHHHQYSSSSSRSSPPSSDFEFSVSNHNMMSADELFFKGRILPFSFKDTNNKKNKNRNNVMQQRTLRDELLDDDHDDGNHVDLSVKPIKSSSSNGWKGFLGLRKSHIGSRKLPDKTDFEFFPQDPNIKSGSQGVGSNEGSSSTDMEMGV